MKRVFLHRIFPVSVLLAALLFGLSGCGEKTPVDANGLPGGGKSPAGNLPPETYLSLDFAPDARPDTSSSRKRMNWWGEDEDGRVVGYYYRWGKLIYEVTDTTTADSGFVVEDTLWTDTEWVETTDEEKEFLVPIRSSSATFTFQVKAVDNDGAEDPTPATISFPVVNSRPEVSFRIQSNPMSVAGTHYTFTTRSFVWDATDPDGNETIEHFYYALDPAEGDTQWVELPGTDASVTLRDLAPGPHTFWLKAADVANFESGRIHFPDSTVATDPEEWVVKVPVGRYLIVDDYELDAQNVHLDFYRAIFDSLYGVEGEAYSTWEIIDLPYVTVDITETLLAFDRVLWFSYYGQPKLRQAFNSMYSFINSSDKRMFLTTMSVDTSMVLDLADSLWTAVPYRLTTTPADTLRLIPQDVTALPVLAMPSNSIIGRPVIAFRPAEGVRVIYHLDESTSTPPQYQGTPVIGLARADRSYAFISVPMQVFLSRPAVGEVIRVLFEEDY